MLQVALTCMIKGLHPWHTHKAMPSMWPQYSTNACHQ